MIQITVPAQYNSDFNNKSYTVSFGGSSFTGTTSTLRTYIILFSSMNPSFTPSVDSTYNGTMTVSGSTNTYTSSFSFTFIPVVQCLIPTSTSVNVSVYGFANSNVTATITQNGTAYSYTYVPSNGGDVLDYSFFTNGGNSLPNVPGVVSVVVAQSSLSASTSFCISPLVNGITYEFDLSGNLVSVDSQPSAPKLDLVAVFNAYNGFTGIGYELFQGNTSVQDVMIPDSVTTIGNNAFQGCSTLEFVYFSPNSQLNVLGFQAFDSTNILNIVIPANTQYTGGAFTNCTNLMNVYFADVPCIPQDGNFDTGNANLTLYCITNSVIPGTVDGYTVNTVSPGTPIVTAGYFYGIYPAPSGSVNISSSGATFITPQAFQNCTSVTSITFPTSLTMFGSYAIDGCIGITGTTITIPNTVNAISYSAFRNISNTAFRFECPVGTLFNYLTGAVTPNFFTPNTNNLTISATDSSFSVITSIDGYSVSHDFPDPVACFTSASRLLTPTGYQTADKIRNGDLLVTADGRQVPVKAFRFKVVADKATAPYLIPKHSLSASSPANDLILSPWHAVQIRKGLWQKPATAAETNSRIVQFDLGKDVTYFHFEAPNYFTDNLVCDGTVVESFANKQVKGDGKVYHYNRALKGFTRSAPVAKKTA